MHPLDAILGGWQRQAAEPLFGRTRAMGKAIEDLCIAFPSRDPVQKDGALSNDPDAWFPNETACAAAVHRIVHLSVETARTVAGLPGALPRPESRPGGEFG